ncbi:MAG: hypothetical protein LBF37_04020, partial [Rickettsiales bacterium]|nr:hypothetical protein [Rickettsiales bacterium]
MKKLILPIFFGFFAVSTQAATVQEKIRTIVSNANCDSLISNCINDNDAALDQIYDDLLLAQSNDAESSAIYSALNDT